MAKLALFLSGTAYGKRKQMAAGLPLESDSTTTMPSWVKTLVFATGGLVPWYSHSSITSSEVACGIIDPPNGSFVPPPHHNLNNNNDEQGWCLTLLVAASP